MFNLKDRFLNKLYSLREFTGKYKKALFMALILLVIPITIYFLQFTQIFRQHAATIPGSYGYSAFGEDVYGTSTVASASAALTPTIDPSITPELTPGITLEPSPSPVSKQGPTSTPTSTPPPASTPTPSPTSPPGSTLLSMTILLHSIGSSGDNVNPNSSSSNKNPKHTVRQISLLIYNQQNQLSASSSANLIYDQQAGSYKGTIVLESAFSTGNYTMKVKEPTHLRRLIPGIQLIIKGQVNTIPEVALPAGDLNGDNSLSVIDYSLLNDCFGNPVEPGSCPNDKKILADLNDDGEVNLFDYNISLREIAYQSGD